MGKTEDIARDPWDQMVDEPNYWYDKFNEYRLLGPGRSLRKYFRKVRENNGQSDLPNNRSAPEKWYEKSKEWHWQERAEAWDESERERLEDEAQDVLSRGLALAHNRIIQLQLLADKIGKQLADPRTTKLSPYLIEQWRGLLDDIAKEKGERAKETRITGPAGGAIMIETTWGRGGSASSAWQALPSPRIVVEEIPSPENGEGKE